MPYVVTILNDRDLADTVHSTVAVDGQQTLQRRPLRQDILTSKDSTGSKQVTRWLCLNVQAFSDRPAGGRRPSR
ncbi:MAG TPA: hypothetical protein VMT49_08355, partial [Steroidobacteraceae bacterium]|nr:hypothetical protein [Steroidobacteraceae bacterium]